MSKCFVILSMHRSASSLVSQAMQNYCGWVMDDIKPGFGQPHGNYEHYAMRKLNDDILKAACGDWRHLPSVQAIKGQAERFKPRIKKVLSSLEGDRKIWGWKDPRSVITIPLMAPYIKNLHLIGLFREPEKAARSMSERDGERYNLGYDEALALTLAYNARLLQVLMKFGGEA